MSPVGQRYQMIVPNEPTDIASAILAGLEMTSAPVPDQRVPSRGF